MKAWLKRALAVAAPVVAVADLGYVLVAVVWGDADPQVAVVAVIGGALAALVVTE